MPHPVPVIVPLSVLVCLVGFAALGWGCLQLWAGALGRPAPPGWRLPRLELGLAVGGLGWALAGIALVLLVGLSLSGAPWHWQRRLVGWVHRGWLFAPPVALALAVVLRLLRPLVGWPDDAPGSWIGQARAQPAPSPPPGSNLPPHPPPPIDLLLAAAEPASAGRPGLSVEFLGAGEARLRWLLPLTAPLPSEGLAAPAVETLRRRLELSGLHLEARTGWLLGEERLRGVELALDRDGPEGALRRRLARRREQLLALAAALRGAANEGALAEAVAVRPRESESVCPYCRDAVADEELQRCTSCGTAHHADCWEEVGGCTTLGCRSRAPRGRVR